jgi:predicted TIM-barrel fold metal-dependent hydrolase
MSLSTNTIEMSATTTAIAQACNSEVRQMTIDYLARFAGLATLPMLDIPTAIAELERAVVQLGLKGAMINDHVNGRTFDEPEFLPFWKAAEQLEESGAATGAVAASAMVTAWRR